MNKQTWEELREKFFKECVQIRLWEHNGVREEYQTITLAPDDLFEWFKKELAGITEPSLSEIMQDFKELNISLDWICQQTEKDAGHSWIEFTDKFQAFQKKIIAMLSASLPIKEVEEIKK